MDLIIQKKLKKSDVLKNLRILKFFERYSNELGFNLENFDASSNQRKKFSTQIEVGFLSFEVGFLSLEVGFLSLEVECN